MITCSVVIILRNGERRSEILEFLGFPISWNFWSYVYVDWLIDWLNEWAKKRARRRRCCHVVRSNLSSRYGAKREEEWMSESERRRETEDHPELQLKQWWLNRWRVWNPFPWFHSRHLSEVSYCFSCLVCRILLVWVNVYVVSGMIKILSPYDRLWFDGKIHVSAH